jgi:hypothetical protein
MNELQFQTDRDKATAAANIQELEAKVTSLEAAVQVGSGSMLQGLLVSSTCVHPC